MDHPFETFYTVEEVASLLRVTPQMVRIWIHQGKLESYQVSRKHRIARSELERLLAESRRPAQQQAHTEAASLV